MKEGSISWDCWADKWARGVKQMWLGVKEMKQKRNKKFTTEGEEVK